MIPIPEPIRAQLRPHPGWYGLAAAISLTLVGLVAIGTVNPDLASLQRKWLPIAVIGMIGCMFPHPRAIGLAAYPLMGIVLLLLLFLIAPGVPRSIVPMRHGARSWINLHFMMFQPSEMTKIVFVLALAWYLRYRNSYRTLRGLLVPFLIMFIPVGLILKEPDLGTALLYAPTLFAVLLAAGAKLRHLGALVAIGLAAILLNVAIIAYGDQVPQWMHVLRPHQEARIASMLWPQRFKQDEGFQQTVSLRLVGAGQVTGVGGPHTNTLVRFNGLPFPEHDMIYAVIANRWGLRGCISLLGLFLVLILPFLAVALRSKDPFVRLSCVGFAAMLSTQTAINIGMTVGLLPITGITLPLISYGGSSLVATFAMVGLMLNFAARRPALLSRPSFEFDNEDRIFQ